VIEITIAQLKTFSRLIEIWEKLANVKKVKRQI
jgi:hypothetical protein